jgi:ABC-type sugar transport system ATPase subunit
VRRVAPAAVAAAVAVAEPALSRAHDCGAAHRTRPRAAVRHVTRDPAISARRAACRRRLRAPRAAVARGTSRAERRCVSWPTSAHSTASTPAETLALQLVDIDKRFGGVHALRGAHLAVRRGEILGLCGENGAGKSTLLKVLAGVYPFGGYTGDVLVDGKLQRLAGPADAHRAGIAVVHQELTLVPELSVAQNLLLGREPGRFGFVNEARLEAIARRDLERFGFADQIDVQKPVQELGIGMQQIVEIVRALHEEARILVLDEPTAALSAHETELLMKWLRSLRGRGTSCIFVSHRLDEVFALCDRVTVLRDGRTAATFITADVTPDTVVQEMVGRSVDSRPRGAVTTSAGAGLMLDVVRLSVNAPGNSAGNRPYAVEGISLALQPGEIVAVAGANGSGRTALLSSLFGCARAGMVGEVRIDGVPVALDSPQTAIRHGLAFLPEDRKGRGIVPLMTVGENLALPSLASPITMGARARFGLVDAMAETQLAERRIRALRIRGSADAPVVTLSGGNQQKVVLGKWLEQRPKVLLLDEPTRGVDIGAREEIYGILEALAADGVAILFASSDLVEVLRLAHRVVVLRDGRCVGELDGASATQAAIVQLATGAARSFAAAAPATSESSNARLS